MPPASTTLILALLASAATIAGGTQHEGKGHAENDAVARGKAFVEANCSGCHAVGHDGAASPNPQAPGFSAVANTMDFTQGTLREFFRDGHESPASMSIRLSEEDAEIAAAYIMSLRHNRH